MPNPGSNRRGPFSPSRIVYQGLVKGAKIRAAEAIRNQATSAVSCLGVVRQRRPFPEVALLAEDGFCRLDKQAFGQYVGS